MGEALGPHPARLRRRLPDPVERRRRPRDRARPADQVVTESLVESPTVDDGVAVADLERDLVKIAVVERHLGTGRIGHGFVRGSGLARGALASTVAHDAHNIVVVGVDDDDMAFAVSRLAEIGGGIVAVEDGAVRAELRSPSPGSSPTHRSPR